ncbi:MAG: sugar transferase [Clostridia bacterium]|nr:sugar transferase [Clostridia bacterium]
MRSWENIPDIMKNDSVKEYYDILKKRKGSLFLKRLFDITVSGIMLLFLWPVFAVIAVAIRLDSKGPVFYRQVRITRYGEEFRIFKFRTMVTDADKGSKLTVANDSRITKVGGFLRKYKLDELGQLIDVFRGKMSFVGTRPEVPKYVAVYTDEMLATLLLPAGITSEASVCYKDENSLLDASDNPEATYVDRILPDKMKYNLASVRDFSFFGDIKIMIKTVLAVFISDENETVNV